MSRSRERKLAGSMRVTADIVTDTNRGRFHGKTDSNGQQGSVDDPPDLCVLVAGWT